MCFRPGQILGNIFPISDAFSNSQHIFFQISTCFSPFSILKHFFQISNVVFFFNHLSSTVACHHVAIQGSPNFSTLGPHQLLNSKWGDQERKLGPTITRTEMLLLITSLQLSYSVTIQHNFHHIDCASMKVVDLCRIQLNFPNFFRRRKVFVGRMRKSRGP